MTQKEILILSSLKNIESTQARNIDEYEKIISWYETFTGIMRDEINTIKIEGTDWKAFVQAHRNDFKAYREVKNGA